MKAVDSFKRTAWAVWDFAVNKAVVMVLLLAALIAYGWIPQDGASVPPFVEVLYGLVKLGVVLVVAPGARLLVFPKAGAFAESGDMEVDLCRAVTTPGLRHYWFATGICYGATLLCVVWSS